VERRKPTTEPRKLMAITTEEDSEGLSAHSKPRQPLLHKLTSIASDGDSADVVNGCTLAAVKGEPQTWREGGRGSDPGMRKSLCWANLANRAFIAFGRSPLRLRCLAAQWWRIR
jgi:hypothetical protein